MAGPLNGAARAVSYTDYVDLEGSAAATLAVSAAADHTPILNEGIYDVWCTVDVFVKVAPTANNYLIRANNTVSVLVRTGSRIGAIAGGAGTLSYHQVL